EQQEEEVTLLHHEASEETIEEVSEGLMKKTPLYEAALFNKIIWFRVNATLRHSFQIPKIVGSGNYSSFSGT
ncbi:hypothetical protein CU098_001700, partial [Rhizopus stolonifer]